MKSILVNYSDLAGGAAIAAYRTHHALRRVGVDSSMWVSKKTTDDWTVTSSAGLSHRIISQLRASIGRAVPGLLMRDSGNTYRSYNWLPSRLPHRLNSSDADIVHLEWVNNETLSIRNFSHIKKPKLMTLHDMWAFCGAEHYSNDARFKEGYLKENTPSAIKGLDADRWVWNRKRQAWTEPFQLVAISEWLAGCIRSSALFSDWPVTVIPNPVDTAIWKPLDKAVARRAFNLPQDKKIVLFGALGGTSNVRKGYVNLIRALKIMANVRSDIQLVVYGQSTPQNLPDNPFPTTYVGKLSDPVTMGLLNSAADVFISPATQEAFGQTASEAQACGLPVVAFADTGIADIVDHKVTGFLAPLADEEQLATGALWVLDANDNGDSCAGISAARLRDNCRERAIARFSYEVVGKQYQALYATLLEK